MASKHKTVNSANLFNFSNGQLTALPTASGNVAVNTLVANTTPPRAPRVETIDLLGDVLGSAVAGAEKGTSSTGTPNVTDLSKTLGVVGKINDAFAVVPHLVQGNVAEAVSEGAGVVGGTSGAAAGFKAGVAIAPYTTPFLGPLSAGVPFVTTAIGAYVGTDNAKAAGEFLTGGSTPDKLGPPTTLPNNTPLQPTAVDSSGKSYALVNVDGKFTWFAMLDNTSLPNRFVEVVSGPKVAELTNSYLKEAGFTEQLQDLKARIDIAHQNGTLDLASPGTYNFPDTNYSNEGRNHLQPTDTTNTTAETGKAPTVFNASTALPNYSGDNAVTVLPGDTVSSIAKRYDMTVGEFSGYLKEQYGPNADLNSIVAGSQLPIPPQVYERTLGGVNGLDLPAETAPASTGTTPTTTPETPDFQDALLDAFTNADQSAADLKAQYPGTLVADAGGDSAVVSDVGGGFTPSNTLTNFLSAQGSSLTPAQHTALALQVNSLGLGGESGLSFYSLPGGGALIANADGDIVGEVNLHSATGSLNLRATAIDAEGNAVEVSQHIQQNGAALTEGQYNAQVQQQAANMFNSLMAVNNWDNLSDLGKFSALANLYNAADNVGEAFSATGNNLPGDLGAAAGWLSLAQGLQSGDDLIIANGINIISNGALDSALNQAFGNTAAGQSVPYLSYALAIRNFAEDPVNAIFTAAGSYAGEARPMPSGMPVATRKCSPPKMQKAAAPPPTAG